MSNIGNALPRELIADAAQGHLHPIKNYLEHNKKFKIDSRDLHGRTLLIYATKGDHIELVKFLLEKGANLEVKDHDDQTAVFYAADRGLLDIVKLFVERKIDLNQRDKEGKTALIYATISNRAEMVQYLLEMGADINIVDAYGRAAISYATYKKLPLLKILLDFHADTTVIGADGHTPLINACRKANLEHVQLLLDYKADPNAKQADGSTALCHAAWYAQRDMLETLIKAGADLKAKDNRGMSVLQYALQANNKAAMDYLSEQVLSSPEEFSAPINPSNTEDKKTKTSSGGACSNEEIQQALRTGRKAWGKSKILIVGEGRAGKTALANSILGKSFEQTSSTIGIQSVSCNVGYGTTDSKSWQTAHQAEQHLETAVAAMIVNQRNNRPEPTLSTKGKNPFVSKDNTAASTDDAGVCLDEGAQSSPGQVAEDSTNTPAWQPSNEEACNVQANSGEPNVVNEIEEMLQPFTSVNQEVVMRCLSNDMTLNCKYNVSLYDFGGQSVFNVIHPFFLSRYGVYLIVFNMEWLIAPQHPHEYTHALETAAFWLNSIVIHTQDNEGHMPPIAFVGTRKDVINNVVAHESISTLLYDTFSHSAAWPYVLENSLGQGKNGQVNLCFFPVNNVVGKDDATLHTLLSLIEKELDQASYIHQLVSLSWFQAYDSMMKSQKAFLPFSEVESITKSCGIATKTLPAFLHFLHEMGMVMWHDEVHLRHVVILNPIEYFVVPTTIVICKHEPTIADSTYHSLAIHKKVRKFHKREWDQMVKFGMLSQKILYALLDGYSEEDVKMLIQLMLKYGLIVKVHSSLDHDGSGSNSNNNNSNGLTRTASVDEQYQQSTDAHSSAAAARDQDVFEVQHYLAPALLPTKSMEDHLQESRTTFYFFFTTATQSEAQVLFNWHDCKVMGFLPNGFFERIISQAISWSQQTSSLDLLHMQLYAIAKDDVTLAFGNQLFRMRLHPANHLIEVIVEGKSPVGIYVRLREQIKKLLTFNGMKKLQFVTLLPFAEDLKTPRMNLADSDKLLIRLSEIQTAMERHSVLSLAGGKGRKMLSSHDIDRLYSGWLDKFHHFSTYDIFFSYRWSNYDSRLAQALFDHLSLYTITSEFRAIRTFLDMHKLERGNSFQSDLAKALISSTIIVPIVSMEGLQRCLVHDVNHVDNMLLEWIIALCCVRTLIPDHTRVKKIIPLLIGSTVHDMVGNLFKEGFLQRMPAVVPAATIITAKSLLLAHQVNFNDHDVSNLTVKDIVDDMTRHLGLEVWTYNAAVEYHQRNLIVSLSERLKEELEGVVTAAAHSAAAGAAGASSTTATAPQRRGSVTESIKTKLHHSHLNTSISNDDNLTMNKELSSLTVHEVETLYTNIGLGMYLAEVQKNALDGEALLQCKTEEDLKEAGITKAFHARKLLNYIDAWQKDGIPPQVLIEHSSI